MRSSTRVSHAVAQVRSCFAERPRRTRCRGRATGRHDRRARPRGSDRPRGGRPMAPTPAWRSGRPHRDAVGGRLRQVPRVLLIAVTIAEGRPEDREAHVGRGDRLPTDLTLILRDVDPGDAVIGPRGRGEDDHEERHGHEGGTDAGARLPPNPHGNPPPRSVPPPTRRARTIPARPDLPGRFVDRIGAELDPGARKR